MHTVLMCGSPGPLGRDVQGRGSVGLMHSVIANPAQARNLNAINALFSSLENIRVNNRSGSTDDEGS